ncbi:amino acid permease [Alicyclobacillus dauci]
MTILKFIVPALTIVVLLFSLRIANFSSHGFAPFGFSGVETAISTGGVMFAYLGLQPIVSVASEAKNPQRTIPIALIVSVLLSAIIYVVLQVAFIGAIPADNPSWGTLIDVVSDALVLTYALAPISAYAFRRNAPDVPRPFFLRGMTVIGPVAFIIASLIVYWTGWSVDSWLLGSQLVMFIIYLLARKKVPTKAVSFTQQVKSSWWLVFYYAAIILVSYLGNFGGIGAIKGVWDQVLIGVIALITYYWGGHTGLPKAILDEEDIDDGTTA